jgi:hypothetical protein
LFLPRSVRQGSGWLLSEVLAAVVFSRSPCVLGTVARRQLQQKVVRERFQAVVTEDYVQKADSDIAAVVATGAPVKIIDIAFVV